MRRIPARYLLNYPADELWDHLTGSFILVMDDGAEIPTNAAETCYSSYVWDFHRAYPHTPLLAEHHFKGVAGARRLSISIDLELVGNAMFSTREAYADLPNKPTRDELWSLTYETVNKSYCGIIKHADAYVGTIDILHFHEAMDEPEIYAANQAVQRGELKVDEVYKIIDKVFTDRTRLTTNPLAAEYRSRLLKQTQVHQNIGPRGSPTDMNSRIFAKPITRGYVEGIRDIYGSAVETRSAARSSYYAAESLRMSEYFSRKFQFVSQNVQRIHQDTDCGSQVYLVWEVRDDKKDETGAIKRHSDLVLLNGKHYLNEETGRLETITPNMHHLLGKKLKLRSTLHCSHPDPAGVCSTCFGDLAFNVPPDANIGQWCATNMAEQATQALLSAKHLDSSSALEKIIIAPKHQKFIVGGPDNSSYCLNKETENWDVNIILKKSQVESLHDILSVEDVEEHPPEHYSELNVLNLKYFDGIISDEEAVDVGIPGSRDASLSHEMLNYIRENKMVTLPNDRYQIDLINWNWDDPVLVMPAKHFNNSDHVDTVARMLESRVAEMHKRSKVESADTMIVGLFDYVNWKLSVNLACLEVILYATTVVSVENNDYSLPKTWTQSQPSVLSMTMNGRSLSVLMAFEKQYEALQSAGSFIHTNRFDHPFDGIYTPTQVFGQILAR